jgi:hypothetical protein
MLVSLIGSAGALETYSGREAAAQAISLVAAIAGVNDFDRLAPLVCAFITTAMINTTRGLCQGGCYDGATNGPLNYPSRAHLQASREYQFNHDLPIWILLMPQNGSKQ